MQITGNIPAENTDPWYAGMSAWATEVKNVVNANAPDLLVATGATTTAAANAWLAAGTGVRRKVLKGTLTLTAPLVIGSNVILDATEARVELASGSNSRMIQTTQVPVQTTTGTIAQGSTSLTTAVTLPQSRVGNTIVIYGAGGMGPRIGNDPGGALPGLAAMHVRIVSISGTTVTVDRPARAAATGVNVSVFPRNTNIHIIGGVWERLSGNAGIGKSFTLERVDGFSIQDVSIITHDSKFAIYVGDFSDGVVGGITLDSNSDGVSLSGPGERLLIQNVHGHTEDDGISLLAASEYAGIDLGAEPWGDLVDVTINNINIDGVSAVAVVASALATCDRVIVDGVTHAGIDGTCKIGNWVDGNNLDVGSVTFRNVTGAPGVNGSGVVLTRGPSELPVVKALLVNNVEYLGDSTAYPTVAIEGVVEQLELANSRGPRALQVLTDDSTVSGTVRNAISTGSTAIATSGHVELSIQNVVSEGDGVQLYGAGPNNSIFTVDAACATGSGGTFIMDQSTGITYTVTGSFGPNVVTSINPASGSTVHVYAESVNGSYTGNNNVFRPRNFAFRVDIARCALAWGLMAFNVNTGILGDGPVVCTGSGWKNLIDDTTWTP